MGNFARSLCAEPWVYNHSKCPHALNLYKLLVCYSPVGLVNASLNGYQSQVIRVLSLRQELQKLRCQTCTQALSREILVTWFYCWSKPEEEVRSALHWLFNAPSRIAASS